MRKFALLTAAFLMLTAAPGPGVAQPRPAPAATTQMVAMRDGVKLATDVYLPGDGTGKYPAIVVRTPYDKSRGGAGLAATATRRGYALVVQDLRGRFKSEGHHAIIFANDGLGDHQDGPDTLAWVARQPWCTGQVGSWGGSALGITQNMAAPRAPDALKAQFVSVAFSDFYSQGAYQGGVFRTQLIERWLQATGMTEKNLPTFVAHPRYDDFWKRLNFEANAGDVRAPAVYHGGWYDIFLQGTLNAFTAVHYRGGAGAKGKCRLVIGPIGHGTFSELKYPANAAQGPACNDAFAWFDYIMLGKNNAVAREKAVHYYVMGDPTDAKAPGNFWRHADHWPPPARPTPFYFHTDGSLARDRKPAGDGSRTYRYDPKDPVPNIGGQELGVPLGPMDQRRVEKRPDVLLFTTAELTEPLEVTGRITAKLFVASDCPDTDFTVKLCDVYPDGRSMLVTDGIVRARYHQSFEKESLLEPGRVYELTVDLWSTSLIFNKEHRLRVAVSSSNSPRFEANPNTGKPFRADKETRVATNTLHLSARQPSHIVLPVAASLSEPDGFPVRVHVGEDYETDIEKRWWLRGEIETKDVPPGSRRACRAVLTKDFDDRMGDPKANYRAVVFNPVPGPPMGPRTSLRFRYKLAGTDVLRIQLFSLSNNYHRNLSLSGLPSGRWTEATVDLTQMRRPDGSGGALAEGERIDDIQFYVDSRAELLIDDIVLYEAAADGEKRPFPRRIYFSGWFDTGRQGQEWPGDFAIVPHEKPRTGKAAKSLAGSDGKPWLRVGLRGERPLDGATELFFRYRSAGGGQAQVELTHGAERSVLQSRGVKLETGDWRSATVSFDVPAGAAPDALVFRLPAGAELWVDDLLLYRGADK